MAGKIDDARFARMSKRYEQEQGENAKKIKALRLELKKDEGKRMGIDDFLKTVRRYTDATTITKRIPAKESPPNTSQSRKQHNEKEQALACSLHQTVSE